MTLAATAVSCGGSGDDKRSEGAGAGPVIESVVAERVVEGGISRFASEIRITFDGPVELALNGSDARAAVSIQVPGLDSTFRPHDADLESVAIDRVSGDELVIVAREIIPDGSRLRIHRSLFDEDGEGSVTATVEGDNTVLDWLLAGRAVAPVRTELYSEAAVPQVEAADNDPAAMREALEEHLVARGSSAEVVERALSYYDGIDPAVVRSPKIAAALAGLSGTFAEPAIISLLTAQNCRGVPAERIAFEVPPDYPDLLARVTFTETGARVLSLNPSIAGERFELLMPILLHEAIHCDEVSEIDEEIAATAFDSFFYMLLVAADPTLPASGTALARNFNYDALGLINSGRLLPESIGVLPSERVAEVFPGAEDSPGSFAEYVLEAYELTGQGTSEPEALAVAYAANLGSDLDIGGGNPFDPVYLDALLGLSMQQNVLLAALDALGLEPLPPG